jgi:hypothetical protein
MIDDPVGEAIDAVHVPGPKTISAELPGHTCATAASMVAASCGTRITVGHCACATDPMSRAARTAHARGRAPTEGLNDMDFLLVKTRRRASARAA